MKPSSALWIIGWSGVRRKAGEATEVGTAAFIHLSPPHCQKPIRCVIIGLHQQNRLQLPRVTQAGSICHACQGYQLRVGRSGRRHRGGRSGLNTHGLPQVTLVGLPDAAVKESSERVRAAIVNSGLQYPHAPADRQPGAGRSAQGRPGLRPAHRRRALILAEQIPPDLDDALFLGELSLDGSVRHVNGILPMAHLASEVGYKSVFVPQADAPEAALVEGITVYPVDALGRWPPIWATSSPSSLTGRRSTWRPRRRPTPRISRTSRDRSTSSVRWKWRRLVGIMS